MENARRISNLSHVTKNSFVLVVARVPIAPATTKRFWTIGEWLAINLLFLWGFDEGHRDSAESAVRGIHEKVCGEQ